MKRIMIIGGAGSGKSTLARKVGDATGLPVIHIDKAYWKPGWKLRDVNETKQIVIEAARGEEWVFDGNNSSTFKDRADRADAIVFLDMPTWLRCCRVIYRSIVGYGRSRPDMADGCTERFDYKFYKWVAGYRVNGGRLRAFELIDAYAPRARIFHLRSRGDVRDFLDQFKSDGRATITD
ncbi:MAG: DNA topology modulation protein FlaR [Hyphomicrobiales bacterium]|nr:DNA topology modulation protein FlaR [Hyphomicrobiales bacterium]